ncbi:Hpt domain-containing protein [Leptothoe sp. PORK10 BA2]|uniref:Hpt domain-containing protein n=1 Tax=Leptothoe sp. PORK10 BA2 TaxID=3110254 RepID=UPI002B21E10D|nr:Hpt domain-containing protein [Leptothoe sp. PORK10 BA2]MEA5462336.1 Hpt domain-containing protein [Leptothoe sp. PORK10 BA2]
MAKTFDQNQLEQLAGGDKAFEKELLQLFAADTENSLSQLAIAISMEDPSAVRSLAHYIKGASANVGAVGMAKIAAQLEALAKSGNLTSAASSLRQLQLLHGQVKRMAR